jgi:metal-dependent amidase/aminoacylase/carboxypeptidase family protein
MASDVEVTINRRRGYRNMNNNMALARRFGGHLSSLGRSPVESDPSIGTGSTDMGDISHAVPSIHPWIQICTTNETTCHQRQFAASADSQRGYDSMLTAAKAMARTAADLLEDPIFARDVRREFDAAGA